ncbi:MAG TPA: glutamate--cysteine ligase [Hyphomicrobiaceae bacterium]|nr:glutamate--cysteine ligase [Hyphomicrobiaceae bacterium]
MSTRQETASSPLIGSRDDLVAWIAAGEKPAERWRIGTEHEKFLFDRATLLPIPYEGPRGVRAIMDGLMSQFGWLPIKEGETVIALARPDGSAGGTVSLEPGGQFELSGDPCLTLHDVAAETDRHLREVAAVAAPMNVGMLGMGFAPTWTRAEMPTMPKRRYGVMTRYMPSVGQYGLDMMYRTCTVQVNLDFADEADMVKKLRVSLALQPIAQAIFASSPFTEGKPNGFKTFRGEVWRDTDKARTGNLPFAFESGMGYERYVDYALDVPMYFVYRDGNYIDVAGASFRDFLDGRLAALPGERPTMADWSDHMTTLFPDVRLKRFLEMRGADGGSRAMILALPAFWVGLLYDRAALEAAWDLVKSWSAAERDALRDGVPGQGLDLRFGAGTVRDIARDAIAIARSGLRARGRGAGTHADEAVHLDVLEEVIKFGTMADEMLSRYEGKWRGNAAKVFEDYEIIVR